MTTTFTFYGCHRRLNHPRGEDVSAVPVFLRTLISVSAANGAPGRLQLARLKTSHVILRGAGLSVPTCPPALVTPHRSTPAAGGSLVRKKIWKVQGAGDGWWEELPEGHTVQHLHSETAQRTGSADPSGHTYKHPKLLPGSRAACRRHCAF